MDQWHVGERLVDSAVVEPVEVVARGPFDVLEVVPESLAVDQFGLVESV